MVGRGRGVFVLGGLAVFVGRGVRVNVARACLVFAVNVLSSVGVLVGVRVGVRLGVKVGEGTSEAVVVGAVDVGKGPKSASEVSARAVLVRMAFLCASSASGGRLDSMK